jgi:uncharacterized protein (TIGR02444 family)
MAGHLDTPLWNFAVVVYGREGVSQECLALQERFGLDVNLLLFGAYTGAVEGLALGGSDLATAVSSVRNWHEDVVRSLRRARQTLKAWSVGEDAVALEATAIRTQVKDNELKAEQIELFMLWTWLQTHLASLPRKAAPDALAENVRGVLTASGARGDDADPARMCQNLLKAASSTVHATPG